MDLKVKNCSNCPFSTFSLAGGHSNLIWTGRRRIQHSCNLQEMATQYKSDSKYKCFDTCPLKINSITVSI